MRSAQTDFYQTCDFKYPEVGILLEDISWENTMGKFFIPVLTPTLSSSGVYETSKPSESTGNILNQSIGVSGYTESNYIEINIPSHLLPQKEIGEGGEISPEIPYKKGDKFIMVFVGGDVNKVRVIGVY